jgi:hypothetical protein
MGAATMRPVLRAPSGIRPGATYLVRERVTLGRAAVADIQLVDESVSRFHALIERHDGRDFIADLASKAGTRLDGRPVQRAVLEAGAVVEIGGFRLRYEFVEDDVQASAVPKVHGYIAVRPTRRDTQAAVAVEPAADEAPIERMVVDQPVAIPPREADWLGLLRDVVELRALVEAGRGGTPRAQALATRFAKGELDRAQARRSSRRHVCRTPVLVGMSRGGEVLTSVGHMLDTSADGAKFRTDIAPPVGAVCWLLVATGESERSGIAFSARVVWAHPETGHAGVEFIGRPVAGPDVLPPLRRGSST